MKINKINLTEAEEEKVTADDIVIDDLGDSSVEEIAAEVQDATDGTKTDAAAIDTAQELKAAAKELGTEVAVVMDDKATKKTKKLIENELTKILDKCLQVSKFSIGRGLKNNCNLLVEGLPGSGKTSVIHAWAVARGLNFVYLNAKNQDLEAYINGYPYVIDAAAIKGEDGDTTLDKKLNKLGKVVTQVYSNNLDALHKKNSILFLDEYNRQTNANIRASLLTLINDKVDSRGYGSEGDFSKTLLFTVAAVNPHLDQDLDASKLNSAELSRFSKKITFDSTVQACRIFFEEYFKGLAEDELEKLNNIVDKNSEEALEIKDALEKFLKMRHLGLYLINDPSFDFDQNDYATLQELDDNNLTMLNQRELTDGIMNAFGDVKEFLYWVEYEAKLLPKNVDMIKHILENYVTPSFDELLKAAKLNVSPEVTNTDTAQEVNGADQSSAETESDAVDLDSLDDELEDDPLFKNIANKGATVTGASASAIGQAINDALNNLNF